VSEISDSLALSRRMLALMDVEAPLVNSIKRLHATGLQGLIADDPACYPWYAVNRTKAGAATFVFHEFRLDRHPSVDITLASHWDVDRNPVEYFPGDMTERWEDVNRYLAWARGTGQEAMAVYLEFDCQGQVPAFFVYVEDYLGKDGKLAGTASKMLTCLGDGPMPCVSRVVSWTEEEFKNLRLNASPGIMTSRTPPEVRVSNDVMPGRAQHFLEHIGFGPGKENLVEEVERHLAMGVEVVTMVLGVTDQGFCRRVGIEVYPYTGQTSQVISDWRRRGLATDPDTAERVIATGAVYHLKLVVDGDSRVPKAYTLHPLVEV